MRFSMECKGFRKKNFFVFLFVLFLLGVTNLLAGHGDIPKYSIKWSKHDSKGTFRADYFDESNQTVKIKREPQLFITDKQNPYDKNDLSPVSYKDITIQNKSKTFIEGYYNPAFNNQNNPFVDETAVSEYLNYDSCYFLICPSPAILEGYDNELNTNCTKAVKFKWYDYLKTLRNVVSSFSSEFELQVKDSKSLENIERVSIKIDGADIDVEYFWDTICNYLRPQLHEFIVKEDYLKKLKKYYLEKSFLNKKVRLVNIYDFWLNCELDTNMKPLSTRYKIDIEAYRYGNYSAILEINPNIEKIVILLDKNDKDPIIEIYSE